MSEPSWRQLYFILDQQGGLMAYQENRASWSGLLAFSDAARAQKFCADRGFTNREIAAVDVADSRSMAALVSEAKKRAVRCLFVDLDYRNGRYLQVEFVGESLGNASERQFTPDPH